MLKQQIISSPGGGLIGLTLLNWNANNNYQDLIDLQPRPGS